MISPELLILRLVHILSGAFWLGAVLMMAGFVAPAVSAAGPAAGPVMKGLQQRKLPTVMATAATLTILSGLRLMWILSSGFSASWSGSAAGRVFGAAGGVAILAFLFGMLVARPATMRMGRLAASLADAVPAERGAIGEELARLRRRASTWNLLSATLLVLAASGMAVARYVG